MSAIKRLQENSDRAKVNLWLDHINEHDPILRAEVLAHCAADPEKRAYYVSRFNQECPA